MKNLLAMLLAIIVAMVAWGTYGPVLRVGQQDMDSALRPFICVGIAYFLIAVLAPAIVLRLRGEVGLWSTTGIVWSFAAGCAGALGALGIILALGFRGSPLYVMPLVFGGAPVVNTFLTMYWARSYKQVSSIFIAGLILVVVGAVTVLVFRPHGHGSGEIVKVQHGQGGAIGIDVTRPGDAGATHYEAANVSELQTKNPDLFKLYNTHRGFTTRELLMVVLFTAMTAVAWGVYGPILHRGQMAMAGSRLRPFLCVGVAYMLIAVLVPLLLLTHWETDGHFKFTGTLWSLAGGAAGVLGALGIILAFNFGGKPIFVMPLVFGGAPVVNTFVSLLQSGGFGQLHPMFYAGLIVVVAGAVTVLVFAPKSPPHAAPHAETQPTTETAPA